MKRSATTMTMSVFLLLLVIAVVAGCTQNAAPATSAPAPVPSTSAAATKPSPSTPAPATAPKPATSAAAPVVELKMTTGYPQTHPASLGVVQMTAEIEKRSNGRLKITVYYGDTLGPVTTLADVLASGGCDFALIAWSYYPGRYPLHDVMQLPLVWPSADVIERVYSELYQGGYFGQEGNNFKMLELYGNVPFSLFSAKKPYHLPTELKGIKMRSGGGAWTALITALGATPLTYTTTELYSLFEKRMIDATFFSFASMQSFKGQEVTNYATLTNLGSFAMGFAMNLQRYNGLPEDLRKIIDDVSKERTQNSAIGKIFDQKEVEGLDVFKKAGVDIYQPTADELKQWRQISDQVVDSWIDDSEKKGLKVSSVVAKLKEIAAKYK